jgi:cytochrome c oxidase subunit 2
LVDTRDEYQGLFDVYWPIGVGVFVVIAVLVAFVALRYRSSSSEIPEGRDRSGGAEAFYAFGLTCIAAALLYLTFSTMADQDPTLAGSAPPAAGAPLQVDVTAAKWNWRFTYPEQGITETGTDEGPPTLVVPAGTPVRFTLTSLDVIHSFWVPERRFKRDAFPDRETSFVLEWERPGFEQGGGECAEFCGLRHSYMDFNVDVKEPADFEAWVADRQARERRP